MTDVTSLTFTGNYIVGGGANPGVSNLGGAVASILRWKNLTVTDNNFYGIRHVIQHVLSTAPPIITTWDRNTYHGDPASSTPRPFLFASSGSPVEFNFSDWQFYTGYDMSSVYTDGQAWAGQRVFVYPNEWDVHRVHIAVFDWDHSDNVTIPIPNLVPPNVNYKLVDAANYYSNTPVSQGIYDGTGSLMVSMLPSAHAPAQPVGWAPVTPNMAPEFAAMIFIWQ